jgi:predicted amidophosphoribosyltransferase
MPRRARLLHFAGQAARLTGRLAQTALARIKNWPRSLADCALPPLCAGCDKDLDSPEDVPLCGQCRRDFTVPEGTICVRCAAPAPQASIGSDGCLHCKDTPFRFHHIAALGVYQGVLRLPILRIKHANGEPLALVAGRLLAERISELNWPTPPDLVAPAPMHWLRRLRRPVNPPSTIAEASARVLRRPLIPDLLRAVRAVPMQTSLTPDQRRRNMRGVFAISAAFDVRDAHVLVIDDVLTTGATANALARPLLKAGAKTVSIGVVARGIG